MPLCFKSGDSNTTFDPSESCLMRTAAVLQSTLVMSTPPKIHVRAVLHRLIVAPHRTNNFKLKSAPRRTARFQKFKCVISRISM